jgi:hypothetical protein
MRSGGEIAGVSDMVELSPLQRETAKR